MFNILSIQDLKRTGFSKIKEMLKIDQEILLQERGKDAGVILDMDYYNHLRECELEMSLFKAKADIANGNYSTDVQEHIKSLDNV